MTPTTALWTYAPPVIALAALLHTRAIGLLVLLLDLGLCWAMATMVGADTHTDYLAIAALRFGAIDLACMFLAALAKAPVISIGLACSAIANGMFAATIIFLGNGRDYITLLAVYNDSRVHGWTTFVLSVVPAIVVTGGGGGGRRLDIGYPYACWRSLHRSAGWLVHPFAVAKVVWSAARGTIAR